MHFFLAQGGAKPGTEHLNIPRCFNMDNEHADNATKDKLIYAWTMQMLLGLSGLTTEASLEGDGIHLESEHVHIAVSTNKTRIIDMRYVNVHFIFSIPFTLFRLALLLLHPSSLKSLCLVKFYLGGY